MQKRPGVRKGQHTQQASSDRYAHLHEDARHVWQAVAEHEASGSLPTLLQIAEATGLTVSEASHYTRQLENNGILQRSLQGVAALYIRPEKPSEAAPALSPRPAPMSAPTEDLKAQTAAIWRFLAEFIGAHGYPPNLREIADGCYLSTTAVTRHLDRLEQAGYIERAEGKARSMRLLKQPNSAAV